ncbi:MAG: hypothetical protein WD051_11105 [Steroidobacteraceae bacterium]
MAENEILDVGSPRRYRRWRQALADAGVSPSETADCLSAEFQTILRNKLRRNPLYVVLKACKADRAALREVVATFKDRALAKLVEQACAITRSTDPPVVARKMADLLVDRLLDRATCYSLKQNGHTESARFAPLQRATGEKLEACKAQVVTWLTASLNDQPIARTPRVVREKPSAESLLSKSLLHSEKKPPDAIPRL